MTIVALALVLSPRTRSPCGRHDSNQGHIGCVARFLVGSERTATFDLGGAQTTVGPSTRWTDVPGRFRGPDRVVPDRVVTVALFKRSLGYRPIFPIPISRIGGAIHTPSSKSSHSRAARPRNPAVARACRWQGNLGELLRCLTRAACPRRLFAQPQWHSVNCLAHVANV